MVIEMRGQMYTLEALIASMIIFGVITIAISTSRMGTETKEFSTLQLKKYADDLLEIYDRETVNHESKLSMWIESDFNSDILNWSKVENELRNLNVMMAVFVYDSNGTLIYAWGPAPPSNAVSSFRVIPVRGGNAYEVRLYVWWI